MLSLVAIKLKTLKHYHRILLAYQGKQFEKKPSNTKKEEKNLTETIRGSTVSVIFDNSVSCFLKKLQKRIDELQTVLEEKQQFLCKVTVKKSKMHLKTSPGIQKKI